MCPSIHTGGLLGAIAILVAVTGCGRQSKSVDPGTRPAEHELGANGQSWFEDFTERAGVQFVHEVESNGQYLYSESLGSGAAFLDFNNDGRVDVYLIHNVNPSARVSNRLFEQQADGRFRDVSAGSGLDVTGYGNGVAVGDLNNDGLPEVLITEYDRIRLFLNEGGGKFRDVTAAAGLTNDHWSIPAAFFDYDRDGWLDLVVGNYLDFDPSQKCFDAKGQQDFCGPHGFHPTIARLYHNLGGLRLKVEGLRLPRFEDVTVRSGFARAPGKAMEIVCADFDGDAFPDVFITDDGLPNRLFMNQRDGTFKEEAVQRGVAYTGNGAALANMGIALGDVDGDGLFDLFVPHLTEENHTLWRQGPQGLFQDNTARSGLLSAPWHGTGFAALFADFDCDGAVDLAMANGRIRRGSSLQRSLDEPPFQKGRQTNGLTPLPVEGRGRTKEEREMARPTAEREKIAGFWRPYAEPSQLFANDGSGHFREVSSANKALCREAVGRGLVCGDIDNDGALDLLLTGIGGPARLLRNVAARQAPSTQASLHETSAQFGCVLDNGRALPPHPGPLPWGEGKQQFDPVHEPPLLFHGPNARPKLDVEALHDFRPAKAPEDWRTPRRFATPAAFSVAPASWSAPVLWRFGARAPRFVVPIRDPWIVEALQETPGTTRERASSPQPSPPKEEREKKAAQRNVGVRHWLGIRAILPSCGGRDAYGAEIVIEAGGRRWWRMVQPAYGYASSNDPRVHIGLGEAAKADSILVRWPDGTQEKFAGERADQYLVLRQGSGKAK